MRRLLLALAAFAMIGVSGCGDDDDSASSNEAEDVSSDATDDDASGEDAGEDSGDDCALLATADLEEALGTTFDLAQADDARCGWVASGAGAALTVNIDRIPIAIDVQEYIDGATEFCDGEATEVDAGDSAYACVAIGSPTAAVFVGSDALTLSASGGDARDQAEEIADAFASLLPLVEAG